MNDTITWGITTLTRTTDNDAVCTVHYTVQAQRPETNVVASSYGTVGLVADPSAEGFIPYEDLTSDDCIGWVRDALTEEGVAELKAALSASIDRKITPTELNGIPWTNEEESDGGSV